MIDYGQLAIGIILLLGGLVITESAINDMVESNNGGLFDVAVIWAMAVVDWELNALELPEGDTRGSSFINSRRAILSEVKRNLELFKAGNKHDDQ